MFQVMTLKKFFAKYAPEKGRTQATKQIQRMPVWRDKNEKSFLNSLGSDMVWLSPLIIADVQQCLEYCINEGYQIDAQWYQTLLDDGIRFLILDGQNRTVTLIKFLNNELTLTGEFIDLDEAPAPVENAFYKDLPQRLQDKFFTSSRISVALVEQATRRDLLKHFLNYNDGIAVNEMQRRDASFGAIAELVHDVATTYAHSIERFIKEQKIIEAADLEFIASAAMHLMRQYRGVTMTGKRPLSTTPDEKAAAYSFKNFGKHDMDVWYDIGFDYFDLGDASSPYAPIELDRFEKILAMVFDVIENQKKHLVRNGSLATRQVWAVLMVCEWMYDNNYTYTSATDFYNELYDIDMNLIDNAKIQFGQDLANYYVNKGANPSAVAPKENQYYAHKASVHKTGIVRKQRFAILLPEVLKNLHDLTIRKISSKKAA